MPRAAARSGSRSPAPTAASPRPARPRTPALGNPGGAAARQARAATRGRGAHPSVACRVTGCSAQRRPGASRTSPTPCRRPATCRSASPTPARTTRHPTGTVAKARWFGAGLARTTPGCSRTDGEYTAFAAVAAGQFDGDQGPSARAARRQRGRQRHAAARSCTR